MSEATQEKSTGELLTAYGYAETEEGNGDWYRPGRTSSERYVRVDGGYEVYGAGTPAVVGGSAWGTPTGAPGLFKIPWKQKDLFATASGLHPATHPDCFEWVWPEERIREIFMHAPGTDKDGNLKDNEYVKVQAEDGSVTYKHVRTQPE